MDIIFKKGPLEVALFLGALQSNLTTKVDAILLYIFFLQCDNK